ncbi:MAG: hypothetical protein ABIM16_00915 [Ginsengibacter sp.]
MEGLINNYKPVSVFLFVDKRWKPGSLGIKEYSQLIEKTTNPEMQTAY